MSYVITGATGRLGRLIVEALLSRGVPAGEIVAGGRQVERLADLAERGVRVVRIDYDDPASLTAAFEGADKLMLVSGSEVGQRARQHGAAIDAARAAGITHIVYTSAPRASDSPLILAPEHKATEELLQASGVPFTVVRNNWYTENYVQVARQAAESGELVSSVGDGRVAAAPRVDYAEGAAAVLTGTGHEGRIYELSGDHAWSFTELAETISDITGREVRFVPVSSDDRLAILVDAGVDESTAGFMVAIEGNLRDGLLSGTSGDLSRLIGRPTTPLKDVLAPALTA